ncbi:MAG: 50S ribosomal protein L25/general stress protein Ctc [Deltaproteobacteria bacterium]|nr:50S ribosomal protein L25/general stress protein Ctc [Deltaproteobacteria bacterium]MBW1955426.1 50S ribosomal protein L25/general stress protein Ctc [Deltaproteobacteria bacterium]MBW2040595.1 50S ribosomal protein L25/general stress protein Ctc [Deltaproteobacteria bacterium]MBW2132284.1 50S ribosomal protein L25/general stress protein Ctc [Deltaproteobacteria bacterium]
MEILELTSAPRTAAGKGAARKFRRQGKTPAVLYGSGRPPVLLTVSFSGLERVLKGKSAVRSIFKLAIQNGGTEFRTVMIKEIQRHPVTREFIHVDFYEVNMDQKIRVNVPVVTKGKAKGEEMGGLLQIVRREIEILCRPMEIPNTIEIDVSHLDFGDAIHVEDIVLDGDVEILAETNFTVVTVVSPRAEEEEIEAEAEAEETMEEGAGEEGAGAEEEA